MEWKFDWFSISFKLVRTGLHLDHFLTLPLFSFFCNISHRDFKLENKLTKFQETNLEALKRHQMPYTHAPTKKFRCAHRISLKKKKKKKTIAFNVFICFVKILFSVQSFCLFFRIGNEKTLLSVRCLQSKHKTNVEKKETKKKMKKN